MLKTFKPAALVAMMSATALLLLGCTTSTSDPSDASETSEGKSSPTVADLSDQAPAGFEEYYSQPVEWWECEVSQIVPAMAPQPEDLQNYECATLFAPMDWSDPESEEIELSVARYIGGDEGEAAPPLFFNLGGPGGAAVDSVSMVVENILTPQVVDAYQVIALDPRGVGASSPIWCMTDEERDADFARVIDTASMTTDERVALYEEETGKLGAQCLERNGDILGFVDSNSAARDFDMARAALGFETMDYIGFSYGTLLGAIYAELFPEHVGHFVLDGALDPAMNVNEVSAAQLEGMENSLYHWIETCQAGPKCPLSGDLEAGKQQMIDLFAAIQENPLPTQDKSRDLNINLAYTGVVGSLYSTETYPLLTEGVRQALDGDGSTLLFLADFYNDRGPDGSFMSNGNDAFVAVNALDYEPVGTAEDWERESKMLTEKFPILGNDFGFGSAGLDAWPVKAEVTRQKITAPDAPDILVIGTTNDPATPYAMAQNLARDLTNGVLLTVEGWDHTAYSLDASDCVRGAVDRFLLNGELPQDGLVCSE